MIGHPGQQSDWYPEHVKWLVSAIRVEDDDTDDDTVDAYVPCFEAGSSNRRAKQESLAPFAARYYRVNI